jgi:single-stranded-DNA-specific exonuclease
MKERIMGKKLWRSLCENLEKSVKEISERCSLPRPIAVLLATRGVKPDEIDGFFKSSLTSLSDPYRFPGIIPAVERIWETIHRGELIMIHGDYDTDGVTATALMAGVLKQNGAFVESFLPHRFDDGYGFTPESLHKSLEHFKRRCGVLITVDCGVNSIEAVEEAKKLGIDVIITDHHEPGEKLPEAMAIINPKVFPETEDLNVLSGVGTAFKLSHAFIKFGRENNLGGFTTRLEDFLDLVALGTVADIVPLLGENRTLVKNGMKVLRRQQRPGVRALIETCRIKTKIKPSDITFKLAPRINAAGRLGNANTALELLDSENIVDAYRYSEKLEKFNVLRQQKEQEIYQEAKTQIEREIDVENRCSILVAGEGWHQGVIGIVASRLARDYNRPVVVLTIMGDEAHGSGRSIGSLNLVDVLSRSSAILDRFGGHPMAVGLGMRKDKIRELYDEMEKNIREVIDKDDLTDEITYDCDVELYELNADFFSFLEKLGPFGHSNSKPIFLLEGVECVKAFSLGTKHARGILKDRRHYQMEFIAFNRSVNSLPGTSWDIIASPQINEYYGEPRPQLQIIDVKPAY